MPGPAGSRSSVMRPGRAIAPAWVLGVEADLDGVPARRRRVALQPAAPGDVELQPDEVGRR